MSPIDERINKLWYVYPLQHSIIQPQKERSTDKLQYGYTLKKNLLCGKNLKKSHIT